MARVLLTGASGFIGSHLLAALTQAGHEVTPAVRRMKTAAARNTLEIDFMRDYCASDWRPRLSGIDAVVNAVGILRERRGLAFEALHVASPRALFSACAQMGVHKVIQISALGADSQAASRYHLSKRHGDEALAALPLDWVIVQPSLVYGADGASARLFTMLAALPLVPLPGAGSQRAQPVHVDDLAGLIVRLLDTAEFNRTCIAAVGPHALTLREMLSALRRSMGLGEARFVHVPMPLVRAAAWIGDYVPGMLLNSESLGMLMRGNIGSPEAAARVLGRPPRPVSSFIAAGEARAAANEARLAWLLPLLRASVALVWIVTGIVSLGIYPVAESYALLARVGLVGAAAAVALYGAALLDIALGVAIYAVRRRRIWVWRVQLALMAAYSVVIAIHLPEYWLHPFGPMLKNVPLMAAIIVLHEFEAREVRAAQH